MHAMIEKLAAEPPVAAGSGTAPGTGKESGERPLKGEEQARA